MIYKDSHTAYDDAIGGGRANLIRASDTSTIAGGSENTVNQSTSGFIGGGTRSTIYGVTNAAIGGGLGNFIGTLASENGDYSFIGGGYHNLIQSNYNTIGGGDTNTIINSISGTIGGGERNLIVPSPHAVAFLIIRRLAVASSIWSTANIARLPVVIRTSSVSMARPTRIHHIIPIIPSFGAGTIMRSGRIIAGLAAVMET